MIVIKIKKLRYPKKDTESETFVPEQTKYTLCVNTMLKHSIFFLLHAPLKCRKPSYMHTKRYM